jgi:hypothetical protein
MFLLDTLDNLPRLRWSDAQLRMIFWLLEEAGCKDVPSFYSFRKMQAQLKRTCSIKTDQHTSCIDNIFYGNDIRQSISLVRGAQRLICRKI